MACSLACMPYDTVVDGPTCAVAVCSGVALLPPVYQDTVLADVPATSDVEVAGVPLTRITGLPLKKLLAAAIADAAGSAVLARLPTAVVRALWTLASVALASAPMVN